MMGNTSKVEVTAENNGPVDKIRDLLFGPQMDSYDQHFQQLETMIANQSRRSIDEMNLRLMALEASLRQRIEKAERSLQRERKERIAAIDTVNDTLQQSFQQLTDQLQKLEGSSTQDMTEVKILLDQQTQSLSSQIQTLREQFNQSLNDQASQLDSQTIKRQKLAGLLSEISTQLARG